jgi:hypothetical protein
VENYAEKIIGALFALWLGVLTVWGKRELDRLDEKADKSDLARIDEKADKKADNAALLAYMEEAKIARELIHKKLDDVSHSTQATAVCLARLEGRLNGK